MAHSPRKQLGRQDRPRPIVTRKATGSSTTSGGGGGGGGGGGSGGGPNRRLAHILSEQKRREKINGGFDELKSVVPECAQNADSKATILRKAVDYILLLEDEIRKYAAAYPEFEHSEENNRHGRRHSSSFGLSGYESEH
ncbi:hypothetical protein BG005_006466 [Podila minutissima]|nr:hypothetical protein BG005_006466 [Podila minutissima]